MSANARDSDDVKCSLSSISEGILKDKITMRLIDIQSLSLPQEKSLKFVENLECLEFQYKRQSSEGGACDLTPRTLQKRKINAFSEPRYVALSYTWRPSPFETDHTAGGYMVAQRDSKQLEESKVRDSVFKRVKAYMDYVRVRYLWIDQHCIEQEQTAAKENGLNMMDRVYTLSEYPVALLFRPIETLAELDLLTKVLQGKFVDGSPSPGCLRLSAGTSLDQAVQAMQLLRDITSDTWFTRGWTFQENYRAGTKMMLLIPHPSGLNKQKSLKLLGYLNGELCINSVDFHKEATKLCLALRDHEPMLSNEILARAANYTILLQDGNGGQTKSMTPTIIGDLVARELGTSWDRLAIAANCCQYSIRLQRTELQERGYSLSLCILALCLINGEILSNHPQDEPDAVAAKDLTIAEFLAKQFFNRLQSPFPKKHLTFNKGCRFVDVELTEEGIQTEGHLWRCDSFIRTELFRGRSHNRHEPSPTGRLRDFELRQLWQLADEVSSCTKRLSRQLRTFVANNEDISSPMTFSQSWQVLMARSIVNAIDEGKTLLTAHLIGETGPQPGNAIFIVDTNENEDTEPPNGSVTDRRGPEQQTVVFTSYCPGREDSRKHDSNDVERHVSMVVDSLDIQDDELVCPPRLLTKRWINGLCLFKGCRSQQVVFPWPASLKNL